MKSSNNLKSLAFKKEVSFIEADAAVNDIYPFYLGEPTGGCVYTRRKTLYGPVRLLHSADLRRVKESV